MQIFNIRLNTNQIPRVAQDADNFRVVGSTSNNSEPRLYFTTDGSAPFDRKVLMVNTGEVFDASLIPVGILDFPNQNANIKHVLVEAAKVPAQATLTLEVEETVETEITEEVSTHEAMEALLGDYMNMDGNTLLQVIRQEETPQEPCCGNTGCGCGDEQEAEPVGPVASEVVVNGLPAVPRTSIPDGEQWFYYQDATETAPNTSEIRRLVFFRLDEDGTPILPEHRTGKNGEAQIRVYDRMRRARAPRWFAAERLTPVPTY